MSDVSVLFISLLIERLEESGRPIDRLLDGTTISLDRLRASQRWRCSWHEFATVIENATDQFGGLDAMEQIARDVSREPPGMVVALARRFVRMHTLYYMGAVWYGPLNFRGIKAIHTDLPDGVIQSLTLPAEYRVSVPVYHAFRGVISGAPRMIDWPDADVDMTYQGREVAYRIYLSPPDTAVAFDEASIEAERTEANAYIEEFEGLTSGLENAPREDAKPAPLTQRVRWLLQAGEEGTEIRTRRAARQLGMSERSLARGLARESTTFRELRDAVRRRQSIERLARGERIEDVARALGFADASSFHRAFRRWTGRSPGSFQPGG